MNRVLQNPILSHFDSSRVNRFSPVLPWPGDLQASLRTPRRVMDRLQHGAKVLPSRIGWKITGWWPQIVLRSQILMRIFTGKAFTAPYGPKKRHFFVPKCLLLQHHKCAQVPQTTYDANSRILAACDSNSLRIWRSMKVIITMRSPEFTGAT
ncbi:MAG TPA: hypothetical protein VIY68_19415 [Steroidobacteraceae bacterium]